MDRIDPDRLMSECLNYGGIYIDVEDLPNVYFPCWLCSAHQVPARDHAVASRIFTLYIIKLVIGCAHYVGWLSHISVIFDLRAVQNYPNKHIMRPVRILQYWEWSRVSVGPFLVHFLGLEFHIILLGDLCQNTTQAFSILIIVIYQSIHLMKGWERSYNVDWIFCVYLWNFSDNHREI